MMRRNNPGARPPRTIRLARPGAVRVGPFQHGREYRVGETVGGVELTPERAARLVAVKGFEDVCAASQDDATGGDDETTEDTTEG